jgi:hypothetical protein
MIILAAQSRRNKGWVSALQYIRVNMQLYVFNFTCTKDSMRVLFEMRRKVPYLLIKRNKCMSKIREMEVLEA